MSYERTVSEHYSHGELLGAIQASLSKLGKTFNSVTIEDLAPVDEFHIGGRLATENLLDQVNFSNQSDIVDVGCGLGGASRFVANKYNNRVTGVDLNEEYIKVGKVLNEWVGLDKQVSLHQGSALSMPFENETFDGALMLHVGMNIGDKLKLFSEVYRLLKPGAYFAIYDVMQINDGEVTYPVPWATEISTSKLATLQQYRQALNNAGFKVTIENNRRDFALNIFKRMRQKAEAKISSPSLGLKTLMQDNTADQLINMIDSIEEDFIAPVEVIVQKPFINTK